MRRLFAIALLALLPFQFTWAAVASYCGHESDAAAQHFGHHEHQHQADAGGSLDGDNRADKTFGDSDADCGYCHANSLGLNAPLDSLLRIDVSSHPAVPVEGTVRTLTHSPPDRPQWLLLA